MFVTTTITYDGEVAQKMFFVKKNENLMKTQKYYSKGIRDLRNGYMSN